MLLFDMPLERLKEYRGSNPRPADHREYWAEAVAEMEALPLDFELTESEFQTDFASCFHLYFTGVGGARIHCQLLQPKKLQKGSPGLCWFHGYSGESGSFYDKLPYVAQGFTCLAMDCRGQGGLSEDITQTAGTTYRGLVIRGCQDKDPRKLYFRQVFLDAARAARILMAMEHIDPDRIAARGRSQGGALTLVCAALTPRVRRIVPTFPFLCDYKRVWELELYQGNAYEELLYYFRTLDPLHEREAEFFLRLGYIDVQHLCDRIEAQVLWNIGLRDRDCPPSAQFAAYNKIRSPKSMRMFPEFAHEMYYPYENDYNFSFLSRL